MTKVIKVTSKGQITLPVKTRERSGIDSFMAVDEIGDYIILKEGWTKIERNK